MKIRRSHERGVSELGWLSSRFSFSFAEYFDRNHMGAGSLRVINDDAVSPASGFGMHPHNDMEIVTIMLDGTLRHSDSMGFSEDITVGDVQYMSAGTGIKHSEINPSANEIAKLLQIWIRPDKNGYEPRYERKKFDLAHKSNDFCVIASGFDDEKAIRIRQNARILRGLFDAGKEVRPTHAQKNMGWYLFVIEGSATVGTDRLERRDAVVFDSNEELVIEIDEASDLLLFDLNLIKEKDG
jgi:quercetin 2,3-dioxygenase